VRVHPRFSDLPIPQSYNTQNRDFGKQRPFCIFARAVYSAAKCQFSRLDQTTFFVVRRLEKENYKACGTLLRQRAFSQAVRLTKEWCSDADAPISFPRKLSGLMVPLATVTSPDLVEYAALTEDTIPHSRASSGPTTRMESSGGFSWFSSCSFF
jgi:hypothetical protein